MDMDDWMKEMGIEDVTGDKEAELEAAINMHNDFTVDNDQKALETIYKILEMMMNTMSMTEYSRIAIKQRMYFLKKYLF